MTMSRTTLRYRTPASRWLECLPLGNGTLGAMLDGGTSVTRIRLNDETAWSGSPESESTGGLLDATSAAACLRQARDAVGAGDPMAAAQALLPTQVRYSQAFLPFATAELTREVPVTGYERELDLRTARHRSSGAGAVVETTFVSAPHGVLVHRIDGTALTAVELHSPHQVLASSTSADGTELLLRLPADVAPQHEPDAPAVTWPDAPGQSLEGAVVAGVRREGGATLVVLATETTYTGLGQAPAGSAHDAAAVARQRVDRALALGWDELAAAHAHDYEPRFARSRIELGTPEQHAAVADLSPDERVRRAQHADTPLAADPGLLSLLFDLGRYLLLSSSRPGSLPPTLQGIWNEEMQPPWSSNYTLNINAEMNMWAAHTTRLPECAEPLHDFVAALAQAGEPTAERLYGSRGWVAHHNSDAWLLTSPVGGGHGDVRWSAWPMAAPWLARHVLDAVEFGAIDKAALRRMWPAVRGAVAFTLDHVRQEDGRWTSAPASSPENAYWTADGAEAALDVTSAMDLSLAYEASRTAIRVAELLEVDDDVVAEARERLTILPAEPEVATDGTLVEWASEHVATDPHHRHVSHLVGLYPGHGRWSERAREAAARTLAERGDESSGWSLMWKGLLWARLGRGERVESHLQLLLRDAESLSGPFAGGLYPNLFAAHPPFQIDANLGLPALLAEAVLQSHDGLHLLPALPPSLGQGRAEGLLARPGVIVDLTWSDGALVSARLRSGAGAIPVRVRWAGHHLDRVVTTEPLELVAADFTKAGRA